MPETLRCLFATPGLGTRDADGTLEVRAPSIRGGLRYWLRALAAAHLVGPHGPGVGALQAAEASLLGGTDLAATPPTSRQSRIRVDVFASPIGDRAETVFILPHNRQGPKPAIPRGYVFDLRLSARLDASPHQTAAARAALDLWFGLGGLGLRARRSLGAVQPTAWAFDTPDHARDSVTVALARATQGVSNWLGCPTLAHPATHPTLVPILHPATAEVFVGTEAVEWRELFLRLMEQIHERQRSGDLPQKVLGSAQGIRQASPLHVSAIALTDGRVVPTFTLFHLRTDPQLDGKGPGGHAGWSTLWDNVADLAASFGATPLALPMHAPAA